MRIFAAKRPAIVIALAAAVLPRLAVLLYARGTILTTNVEKSDTFATVFVKSGTYGFVPGVPSAYTQPLYGWFLIPLYWILGRHWLVVGLAQILVASATTLVVLAIARRFLPAGFALLAALIQTLNPYLVWHDVHVNREILDQLIAAVLFLLALRARERATPLLVTAIGATCGLAILGNSRLVALPIVLALYVAWGRRPGRMLALAGMLAAATLVVLAPWAVRNKVQLGCWAVTTDSHALWKANNANTYATLAAGKWIDDVPPLPGAPTATPEYEPQFFVNGHEQLHIDECRQQKLYEDATISFWRHHPGAKAKLMGQATEMLWDPRQTRTEGGPTAAGAFRQWAEAAWAIPVYLLALLGLFAVPRSLAVLAATFVGYETIEAWVFAGATRYRISFDFVLALLAAAGIERLASRRR